MAKAKGAVKSAEPKKLSKIDLGMALFGLAEKGVKTIEIRYSGGGDSGSIEEVNPLNRKQEVMKVEKLERWDEIQNILEEWAYKRLEDTEGDWINNEGGSGTFTIQVPSGEYELAHSVNITKDYDHSGLISEELED
jgi:hypothetical protein